MFARATFLPTLVYNLGRNRWQQWHWWDRVDELVVLGALPFRGPVTQQLHHHEHIRSVVSMNEDFELRSWFGVTTPAQWRHLGVSFLQLNTQDILHAPSQDKLHRGVRFILESPNRTILGSESNTNARKEASEGAEQWSPKFWRSVVRFEPHESCSNSNNHAQKPSVYVHCKAGRTRSATLVACYLIQRYNLTPRIAVNELKAKRPQVLLHTAQWEAIELFYEQNCKNNKIEHDSSQNSSAKVIISS